MLFDAQFAAVDREAVWAALFAALQGQLWAPGWQPGVAVTEGQLIVDPQGYFQKAQGPGTTGATAPEFDDAPAGVTNDGSGGTAFTWQRQGAGFVSIGRKHKAPPDLGTAEQPALFVVQMKESRIPNKPPGYPSKLILRGFLIIYFTGPVANEDIGTETVLAATQMNDILYAIDQALTPDDVMTGKYTIGGLATHCWIEGEVPQDPGVLGSQCAAMLPLHIRID